MAYKSGVTVSGQVKEQFESDSQHPVIALLNQYTVSGQVKEQFESDSQPIIIPYAYFGNCVRPS